MVYIEAGTFAFMIVFAFGFMLFAFRMNYPFSPFLRLASIAIFLGVAVLLASGYGVQVTRTFSDSSDTWTEVTPVIPSDGSGGWIAYIFIGLVTSNLFFMVKEVYQY